VVDISVCVPLGAEFVREFDAAAQLAHKPQHFREAASV
jgi:hypothetical protein